MEVSMSTFSDKLDYSYIDTKKNALQSLFESYEKVIIESLIQSFGLDFLINDQHGGDVDTIHNVRMIGKDPQMNYKNSKNAQAKENNGPYDPNVYHKAPSYKKTHDKYSQKYKEGTLPDAYTGLQLSIENNDKWNLDHVISAKEIHMDPGRILSGLDGIELANDETNLKPTNEHLNKSMRDKPMEEYLQYLKQRKENRERYREKLKSKKNLTVHDRAKLAELDRQDANEFHDAERMRKADEQARQEYERKINLAYYTSASFIGDTTKAAVKLGCKMGVRQAFGFILAQIWFSVKEKIKSVTGKFDLSKYLVAISEGFSEGCIKAKNNFKEMWNKFISGSVAGALSSIVTTIINIFATTASNTVRLIRQSWTSIVEAFKTLIFNPENLPYGDLLLSVAKIISTGASIIVGTLVSQQIESISILGGVIPEFIGTMVTGCLSCTLLYFLDSSPWVRQAADFINKITSNSTITLKQLNNQIDEFNQELMKIDLEKSQRETSEFVKIADTLILTNDENKQSEILIQFVGKNLPWTGNFDDFMSNCDNKLIF